LGQDGILSQNFLVFQMKTAVISLALRFKRRGCMSDETVEIETIRKYLLGDLPEAEAERIEKWYFADGRAVDEIWASFGELAEDRLSGALSEGEALRFDQRLLSSPALREMFENEKALRDYAVRITMGASRQVKSGASAAGGRRHWRLLAAFFKSPKLLVASFVALIALSAPGVWLVLREGAGANPEGSQQAIALDQRSRRLVRRSPLNQYATRMAGRSRGKTAP
jgi:hypothetical protein